MQNRIDRLILNGNNEFSEQRNVISALIEYSRCLDLYEFQDRNYKIQLHEVLVRIAICYDILGNFNKTIEYLNKSLSIVNNVNSLILYKSVLLQTLGKNEEAQKILIKYKQIIGKRQAELYETFRLVFFYTMQLEKEVLLIEINEFLNKYSKNAVILYLRAMIYLDFSNSKNKKENDYYARYENDLKEAIELEPTDTEYLIKDGITNENLTKLFFMILPDMDFYQPKPLVNYTTYHTGLKVFYIIFKAIKLFKIKIEKKKIKRYYNNKLKQFKLRERDNSESSNNYSNNSLLNQNNFEANAESTHGKSSTNYTEDINNTNRLNKILKVRNHNNISDRKIKNPNIVKIKNNVEKANNEENINEIKKEYENHVKGLYRSVWLSNMKYNTISMFNIHADYETNFFIKYKYYAPFNLKDLIINSVKQNQEYKSTHIKKNSTISNVHTINNHLADLSASEIQSKKEEKEEDSISFSSEINLLESNITKNINTNNTANKSDSLRVNDKEKRMNKVNSNNDLNGYQVVRKLIHKPSPRMDLLRLNSNKFISFSKERKIELKYDDLSNNNSNNTNLASITNNCTSVEKKDSINMRKSMGEFQKGKIPDHILKKVNKPMLFKNMTKAVNKKIPLRLNSNLSGGSVNMKSTDNI